MSAHPWLHEMPWPTKAMPRKDLEELLIRFLSRTNMGVVSTIDENGDVNAAPLEYHADGLNIYIYPQPGSSKMANLKRDQKNIMFCANMPYYSWASTEGVQMKCHAKILKSGTPEHDYGMTIFKWQFSATELGRDLNTPPNGDLVLMEPVRIQYTSHWNRKYGYAPRQIWLRDSEVTEVWKPRSTG